jgi:hypothetical protein
MKQLVAACIAAILAGCASDPRYAQGLEWVVWNEQEKARLQAQGFPQFESGSDR